MYKNGRYVNTEIIAKMCVIEERLLTMVSYVFTQYVYCPTITIESDTESIVTHTL